MMNCRASLLATPSYSEGGPDPDQFYLRLVGRLCQTPIELDRRFAETPYNFRFRHRKILADKATASNARLGPHARDFLEYKPISRESIPRCEGDDRIHPAAIGTAAAKHKAR